ncbi:antibiotic ABC transporter permease [Haloarcula pelagica]|uniref:antibiotic ABC transporter permease n=1 Tax=Haloarcula pelagica TaxID=3033389 RepID=UPI0024C359BA|nr:antibiotic ABC transporter permease [Halomicroarcula sp. YJ-61-S]
MTEIYDTSTTEAVDPLFDLLERSLAYAREREYLGWDYCDGMSSRVWRSVPVQTKWSNLAFQEVIKRGPPFLRRLFLVEPRRNYKGAALFAMANQNAHELRQIRGPTRNTDIDYLGETRDLLDWLVESNDSGNSGFGLGHPHAVQDLQGYASPNTPDSVVTSYAVKALLRGATLDPAYARVAASSAELVENELDYTELDDGTARITYSQNHPGTYYTLNAGALGARLLVDLYAYFGDDRHRRRARKLLDHIVDRQEPIGGWKYRDPPDASHLSMDTHHNGFILESLQYYRTVTADGRYDEAIDDAMTFHRETLFTADGAPNFDENDAYPRDIHAAAQGILVFSYAGEFTFARRIIEWTLENLFDGEERFYFRKTRYRTRRITLMRWCQAWMAYAISEYLVERTGVRETQAP